MGRALYESESGRHTDAVRSLERVLSHLHLDPYAVAIATMALGSNYALIGDKRVVATRNLW